MRLSRKEALLLHDVRHACNEKKEAVKGYAREADFRSPTRRCSCNGCNAGIERDSIGTRLGLAEEAEMIIERLPGSRGVGVGGWGEVAPNG
jgi:hypothetical protein